MLFSRIMTLVMPMSMNKIKVMGQRSRSQRSNQVFSCSRQLYRRLCLSVCLSVCACVCVRVCVCNALFTMFLSLDLHQTYTRHWSYEMLVAHTIWGQKVKGQGHRGHSKVFSCPLRGSVAIWLIWFILGTNIVHDMTMCRVPFLGQKVKGQGHTGHFKWGS